MRYRVKSKHCLHCESSTPFRCPSRLSRIRLMIAKLWYSSSGRLLFNTNSSLLCVQYLHFVNGQTSQRSLSFIPFQWGADRNPSDVRLASKSHFGSIKIHFWCKQKFKSLLCLANLKLIPSWVSGRYMASSVAPLTQLHYTYKHHHHHHHQGPLSPMIFPTRAAFISLL